MVYIHTLEHAQAALKAADNLDIFVTLCTPPGAEHYIGLTSLQALFEFAGRAYPNLEYSIVLDCAMDVALAHRAILMGFQTIILDSLGPENKKLKQIASKSGIKILNSRLTIDILDLLDSDEPYTLCKQYYRRSTNSRTK